MPSFYQSYPGIIAALAARFGTAEVGQVATDAFERMVSALLNRTLEARNVARVIEALREAGLREAGTLAEVDPQDLQEVARLGEAVLPSTALRTLQRLARWLVAEHQSEAEALQDVSTDQIREELLSLRGIGPASADAILLEALGRPIYPVDRATYRILLRHGWLDPGADYDEARNLIELPSAGDPAALSRMSVWFERIGREACRASVPHCERCPLQPYLPQGGPREPEG